jgi:hypothetical protein
VTGKDQPAPSGISTHGLSPVALRVNALHDVDPYRFYDSRNRIHAFCDEESNSAGGREASLRVSHLALIRYLKHKARLIE